MNSTRLFFLRLGALLSAIWILLVSIGASVSVHYCNGNVIDFAIDKRAEACKGYYQAIDVNPEACSISKKGCCEDADWLFVVENDYPPSNGFEIPVSNNIALSAIENLTASVVKLRPKRYYAANAPPLIQTDIQVLFQVFLI